MVNKRLMRYAALGEIPVSRRFVEIAGSAEDRSPANICSPIFIKEVKNDVDNGYCANQLQ
jgi:hypothetical protein